MTKIAGKKVVVTGGAGFIGSHLVDRLIQENPSKLIVVDNFFLGHENNLTEAYTAMPDICVYRLDVSDLASMRDLADKEKIDVLFNLAVIPLPMSLSYPRVAVQSL